MYSELAGGFIGKHSVVDSLALQRRSDRFRNLEKRSDIRYGFGTADREMGRDAGGNIGAWDGRNVPERFALITWTPASEWMGPARRIGFDTLFWTGGSLLLLLLLVMGLASRIAGPIVALAATMRAISGNDTPRRDEGAPPASSSSDEIQELQSVFRAMSADVAEKRARLDTNLSLLAATIEATADGLQVVDLRGRVVLVNNAFSTMWGVSADGQKGEPDPLQQPSVLENIIDYEDFRRWLDNDRQTPDGERNIVIALQDGRYFACSVGPQQIGSAIVGQVRSFRDITESKIVEKALIRSNEALQHSNSDLQQFAYIASHDLREPLRTVSSFLQILVREYRDNLDDMARQYIDFAVGGAVRMNALIEDLLKYSRVETETRSFAAVDVGDVLREVEKNLFALMVGRSAVLRYGRLPKVRADRLQLLQLFQNLIGNALKYGSPDPTPDIRITGRPSGDQVAFSVRDNGIGIEPEHFERIFVIFQRLHPRDAYEGTGIGLAICKRIIERHGGRIWVESLPDMGSTFHFTLPAAEEKTAAFESVPDGAPQPER